MSNRAWVTLATNDSYGLGALVLAHSLRRVGSTYPVVVLITPSVTEAMRERLRAVFAEVITVDVLDSQDAAHLALLQRPELGITFTKIHCWSLTQYEKCVFLDADTLVVQNSDELFDREELSAAPDVGWPDCFNSGVFVFSPSQDTFDKLIKFAQERGSFDGGDQGLLNAFFSDWAHDDIKKHLPFLYNVTSAAFYSYLPALKHYGQNLKIIHFIGAAKPWLQQFNWESRTVDAPDHIRELLQQWWDLFVSDVHSQLDTTMTGVAGNLARVIPGSAGVPREAIDELTRRQGWEAGNIDYMGADAFENIWAKISQTLNQPRTSPPKEAPKEATPPPKQPSPPKEPSLPKESSPPKQPSPPKEPSTPKEPAPSKEPSPPKQPTPPKQPSPPKEPMPPKEPSLPKEAPAKPKGPQVAVPAPKEPVEAAVEPTVAISPAVEEASDVPAKSEQLAQAPVKTEEAKPVPQVEEVPKVVPEQKTEVPLTPPASPASEPSTPVTETPKPVVPEPSPMESAAAIETAPASPAPEAPLATPQATPEKATEPKTSTDSPPLANTPSKEDAPSVPVAKLEERRKPAGKLQLCPPVADPLPTPDSELEDAASLAHAIIASELATPTVTSPSPPVLPSPQPPLQEKRLSVDEPEVPTPPIGNVSLAQIGVKPKTKATTAALIESSVSETPVSEAAASAEPKKKVIKKVVKKEGSGAEAPVPPPRKKEKKPKDK